jgi:hypothetical protein
VLVAFLTARASGVPLSTMMSGLRLRSWETNSGKRP